MPSFLGGKSGGAFGQPAFFLAGNRMTIVAFEKEVSLRWLHTVSHQFQQTNIHNFFDDFQDIDLHFTREKLQKQLA